MAAPTAAAATTASSLPKAIYRRLGASGLRVSVPILGAMSLGDPRWQPWVLPEATALPLLKAAYDRGITTWDTANVYSNGRSEEIIAAAIKTYNLPRHKLVLLTKICGTVREGNDPATLALQGIDDSADYVNQRGLSRAGIFNAVDACLERLGTGYIDLLQIHRFDKNTPVEETMRALHDLVRMGKVRYLGASSMWATQFAEMQWVAERNGWTKFVSMQNNYNLLYREEEREMLRFCNSTGVGVIPWGPLAHGTLARPPPSSETTTTSESTSVSTRSQSHPAPSPVDATIIARVHDLAGKKGWPMSHIALAWLNVRVAAPIIGLSSVERMEEALGANGRVLELEEEKFLEELYVAREVVGFDTSREKGGRIYA